MRFDHCEAEIPQENRFLAPKGLCPKRWSCHWWLSLSGGIILCYFVLQYNVVSWRQTLARLYQIIINIGYYPEVYLTCCSLKFSLFEVFLLWINNVRWYYRWIPVRSAFFKYQFCQIWFQFGYIMIWIPLMYLMDDSVKFSIYWQVLLWFIK